MSSSGLIMSCKWNLQIVVRSFGDDNFWATKTKMVGRLPLARLSALLSEEAPFQPWLELCPRFCQFLDFCLFWTWPCLNPVCLVSALALGLVSVLNLWICLCLFHLFALLFGLFCLIDNFLDNWICHCLEEECFLESVWVRTGYWRRKCCLSFSACVCACVFTLSTISDHLPALIWWSFCLSYLLFLNSLYSHLYHF